MAVDIAKAMFSRIPLAFNLKIVDVESFSSKNLMPKYPLLKSGSLMISPVEGDVGGNTTDYINSSIALLPLAKSLSQLRAHTLSLAIIES